jgi:hypothetical protein
VLRVAGSAAGWLLAVVAVVAGVGWLYLLRRVNVLAVGPKMSGALPLEELARQGAQPLLRMAVAWLPAGFAAGLALAIATRMRPAAVVTGSGLLALFILGSTTAASEAVSRSEPLADHVWPALSRSGLWTAVAFTVIGSILAAAAARAGPRGRSRASRSARAGGFWAA